MDIFESLENLQVSEECFDEIIGIVEEILSEDIVSKVIDKNKAKYGDKIRHTVGALALAKDLEKVGTTKFKEHENSAKNKGIPVDDLIKERTTNKNIEGEKKTDKRRCEIHKKKFLDPQTDIYEYPKAQKKYEYAVKAADRHYDKRRKSETMRNHPNAVWYEEQI